MLNSSSSSSVVIVVVVEAKSERGKHVRLVLVGLYNTICYIYQWSKRERDAKVVLFSIWPLLPAGQGSGQKGDE